MHFILLAALAPLVKCLPLVVGHWWHTFIHVCRQWALVNQPAHKPANQSTNQAINQTVSHSIIEALIIDCCKIMNDYQA